METNYKLMTLTGCAVAFMLAFWIIASFPQAPSNIQTKLDGYCIGVGSERATEIETSEISGNARIRCESRSGYGWYEFK